MGPDNFEPVGSGDIYGLDQLFELLFGQNIDEKERQNKLIDLIKSYSKEDGSKLLRDIGAGLHLWSILNGYKVLDIIDILYEVAMNVEDKMTEDGLL
jgi:hypothetical protein